MQHGPDAIALMLPADAEMLHYMGWGCFNLLGDFVILLLILLILVLLGL